MIENVDARVVEIHVKKKTKEHPFYKKGSKWGYTVDDIQGQTIKLSTNSVLCLHVKTPGHPFYFSGDPVGGFPGPTPLFPIDHGIEKGNFCFIPMRDLPSPRIKELNNGNTLEFWYQCSKHPYMGGRVIVTPSVKNNLDDGVVSPVALRMIRSNTAPPAISLNPMILNLRAPTAIAPHPREPSRFLLVGDQGGSLWGIDLKNAGVWRVWDGRKRSVKLSPGYDERGLLGVAWHPKAGSGDDRVFVYISVPPPPAAADADHIGLLMELRLSTGDMENRPTATEERPLMRSPEPFANHNGGSLAFGPHDGMLYIGRGDGGGAGDPLKSAQNLFRLHGKILRIDVNNIGETRPYKIPEGNVTEDNGLQEVFVSGIRNPWGLSFAPDGRLFVADVGQDDVEEISIFTKGGENGGWPMYEGSSLFSKDKLDPTIKYTFPIYEYEHDRNDPKIKAVVGGVYVADQNVYVGGDWGGHLFVLEPVTDTNSKKWKRVRRLDFLDDKMRIKAFGAGPGGSPLYVAVTHEDGPVGSSGIIYQIQLR